MRNILSQRERLDAVPFFWSQHYDTTINYMGHAERWDAVKIDGNLKKLTAPCLTKMVARLSRSNDSA